MQAITQFSKRKSFEFMKRLPVVLFTLLFSFFLLLSNAGFSKNAAPKKLIADSSKVQVKKFDEQAIQKLKADKEFNYNGEAASLEPSLWARFWSWVWEKLSRLFNGVPYSGYILKFLLLGLSVCFLAYIIFKSIGIDIVKLWQGDAKQASIPYTESLENIHEINFDAEIEKAISEHNYSFAVRLLYLKCLKQLSDKNLIEWQIDKTNSAYVYELTDTMQKQSFALLTKQFEYVWYGNFAIDKQSFSNINQLFQDFKKQIT